MKAGDEFAVWHPWTQTLIGFPSIEEAHAHSIATEHDGPAFLLELIGSFHCEGAKPIAAAGFIEGAPRPDELNRLIRERFGPPNLKRSETR